MRKFRFQYTLRTVFIISFIVAILCSLIKCEIDARENYAQVVGVVEKTLAKVEREIDTELSRSMAGESKTQSLASRVCHNRLVSRRL